MIMFRKHICIIGNHDLCVLEDIDTSDFSREAIATCVWSRERLDENHLAYLQELPTRAEPISGMAYVEFISPADGQVFEFNKDGVKYLINPGSVGCGFIVSKARFCAGRHPRYRQARTWLLLYRATACLKMPPICRC